ncbi:tyrosine-type recombinase/integrase [Actinokineospora sp. PR83]|uniref:tyrosine-type recombinase/integrase n=1 Tax=Actinokineospora sp. PR83 TaxID=2884908 RepID=UPI001F2698D7|nr:tyrosine-type recombinase/integrase [Actinokineospora sp. PR83]MCG8919433.1 tyrosine-type recombinase/integrase [Actinokineospora sp. PR83]
MFLSSTGTDTEKSQSTAAVVVPAGPPVVAGSGAVTAELLARATAEFPTVVELGERERLLVSAWLSSLRSARTRRAYLQDVRAWLGWCEQRGVDVLGAGRVHVDLWVSGLADAAESSTTRRRLSGVSSFYRYLAKHDLVGGNPVVGVERPVVDPDHTATVGLSREEGRALIAASEADAGAQRLRSRVVIKLLLHNALRVDELAAADIADLGHDRGHRILGIMGKGGRKAKVAITPPTGAAIEDYLAERAEAAGVPVAALSGPLVATRTGKRMTQSQVWELVRRLAKTAGIASWEQLSPHSLRHTAITAALEAGVGMREAQDYARHRDPRTTRRYDHSRHNLDRSAAYTVAAYLAE